MIKKLDLYIFKKFILTFVFMDFAIGLVCVIINFSEILDDVIDKNVPLFDLFTIFYPNFFIFFVNLLSPICIFLSVIFFTSKLAQDTEIVAMLSAGISFYRVLVPYLVTSLILFVFSFAMNAYFVPNAVTKRLDFEYEYLKNKHQYGEYHIHRKIDFNSYVYIYSYNQFEKVGTKFTIDRVKNGKLIEKIDAEKAYYLDSIKKWKLENVRIRYMEEKGERIVYRNSFDTTMKFSHDDIYKRENYAESLTLQDLYNIIELEKSRGSDAIRELELEKYKRIAFPFASVVLTIIGFALSTRKQRGGIAVQLGIGLLISFLYIFLLTSAQAAAGESAPPWLPIWIPNIVFLLVGLGLLRWAPK